MIANQKKKYNKRMLNVVRIKAKTSQCITKIVKEIKTFDAILHAKVAWEAIEPETITKCFKQSGIQENYDTPPSTPEPVDEDTDFPEYFENLLNIPWDEYLAMDEELEKEEPTRAPDTLPYTNDASDDTDHRDQEEERPSIKHDDALDYLHQIQKSNLGDMKLFGILEQAMTLIQNKKL